MERQTFFKRNWTVFSNQLFPDPQCLRTSHLRLHSDSRPIISGYTVAPDQLIPAPQWLRSQFSRAFSSRYTLSGSSWEREMNLCHIWLAKGLIFHDFGVGLEPIGCPLGRRHPSVRTAVPPLPPFTPDLFLLSIRLATQPGKRVPEK